MLSSAFLKPALRSLCLSGVLSLLWADNFMPVCVQIAKHADKENISAAMLCLACTWIEVCQESMQSYVRVCCALGEEGFLVLHLHLTGSNKRLAPQVVYGPLRGRGVQPTTLPCQLYSVEAEWRARFYRDSKFWTCTRLSR